MELKPVQRPAEQAGAAKVIPAAVPAGATRVVPAGDVVQLPPGTRLDAIRLSGNDLVVTLPDGQILVIVDGALHIPLIRIGPITIPSMFMNALPYILTVIILAGFVGRAIPPRAGGEPYVKER